MKNVCGTYRCQGVSAAGAGARNGGPPSTVGGGPSISKNDRRPVSGRYEEGIGDPLLSELPADLTRFMFDDFSRVNNLGNVPGVPWPSPGVNLGTATSGYVWLPKGIGGWYDDTTRFGCDGFYFFTTQGLNFNFTAPGRYNETDPWNRAVFTMRTRFNISVAPSSYNGAGGTLILDLGVVGLVVVIDYRDWNGSYGGHIEIGGGGFSAPGSWVYSFSNWVADAWYIAELLWDTVNQRIKVRVYDEGFVVPDWQVDRHGATFRLGGVDHMVDLGFLLDTYGSSTHYKVQVDYIDFVDMSI